MDERCCPQKEGLEKCSGFGKLGKGDECETISMACSQIKEEDLESCAMYKRSNFLGLFGSLQIPGLANYLVYPLADKYGNETPSIKLQSRRMGSTNCLKELKRHKERMNCRIVQFMLPEF